MQRQDMKNDEVTEGNIQKQTEEKVVKLFFSLFEVKTKKLTEDCNGSCQRVT